MPLVDTTHRGFGTAPRVVRCAPAVLALAAACVNISRATAATDAVGMRMVSLAAQAPHADDPAARPDDEAERQRVAQAMVYVVVGIAIVGIVLIVLIVLGGHRIRQRAKTRAPRGAELDPLWYLRHSRSEPVSGQPPTDRPSGAGPPDAGDRS